MSFNWPTIAATGPHLWNSLPSHLRLSDIGYNEFKRQLKIFLFEYTAVQRTALWLALCALYKYSFLFT